MVLIPTAVPPGAGTGGDGGSPGVAAARTALQGGPSTSLTGWNHLTRTWAVALPNALHDAQTIRRAATRLLPSGRKVGR